MRNIGEFFELKMRPPDGGIRTEVVELARGWVGFRGEWSGLGGSGSGGSGGERETAIGKEETYRWAGDRRQRHKEGFGEVFMQWSLGLGAEDGETKKMRMPTKS